MFQGYYTERKIQDIQRYYISLLDECLCIPLEGAGGGGPENVKMKNVKFVYCSEFPSWCKTALDLHYFPSSFAFVLEETFKLERNQTFQIKSDFKVSFVLQVTSTYPCLWPSLKVWQQQSKVQLSLRSPWTRSQMEVEAKAKKSLQEGNSSCSDWQTVDAQYI